MGSLDNTLTPFPDDVPTVPIARISYSKLKRSEENEMIKVLKASQSDGFFYLDLIDDFAGQALLKDTEDVLTISKRALNIPLDKKMECLAERGKQMFGYKPAGAVKQTDKDARPDTTEFFNVSKDHLLGNSESRKYPAEITDRWTDLGKYAADCHSLAGLAKKLIVF
ncbi:hypothetical protein H9Q72_007989 [Fusarium xylarioides]|uniref:Non-haem dioxygenase N-terminal domain-containing protein n=1 Tax=Fusarium xylarioides TaxID=221167 RepID=A0A9P7L056_9HYPO|nr:hypothetical protein H9Q72_007989 [Fusarium xylarioides]